MIKKILLLTGILAMWSCQDQSGISEEIEKISVDFKVERFDEKFSNITPEELPQLKAEYPFLFPERFPDSVWIEKINDTIQQEINTEVSGIYSDFSEEEEQLHSLFQHIKYYYPSFEAPTVLTITSEVDYKNKVLLTPEYLFIALDTYLGKDHKFYLGIQEYLKKNFERNQIIQDVATEFAKEEVPQPEAKTFLANMIYYGKILYLKDRWLPETPNHQKIGYTGEELEWAKKNEAQIWRYFVERQIIFDSDTQLYSRFLYPAPFSKFYLELDNEAPAMLGQFIGWEIVRAYMDEYEVSLQEMLATDAETIFNKAKYKPKK
ncbi:gliding motility lipoprotein GldB [Gillisia limnaea]|uniref:Protein involved in gliding motility GldB n=1 Tax=Gillisia limnaea (strain DSM 15749 / LMG 21470 / R-8282) TaxID=865937 RepID=H2BS08_GILLR|nr:gliding motility lipoprotein GldB [Gillisia limnaea]EHQ03534.1 protein involved in gliding motility GldB [Gillisia limnaea DSM 15749]